MHLGYIYQTYKKIVEANNKAIELNKQNRRNAITNFVSQNPQFKVIEAKENISFADLNWNEMNNYIKKYNLPIVDVDYFEIDTVDELEIKKNIALIEKLALEITEELARVQTEIEIARTNEFTEYEFLKSEIRQNSLHCLSSVIDDDIPF